MCGHPHYERGKKLQSPTSFFEPGLKHSISAAKFTIFTRALMGIDWLFCSQPQVGIQGSAGLPHGLHSPPVEVAAWLNLNLDKQKRQSFQT